MPKCVINEVPVWMEPHQSELYEQLKQEMVISLKGSEINAANAAALSGKLLQMANGAVYDGMGEPFFIHDGKLNALEDLIEGANGKPVLIAYWYKHDLDRIKARFDVTTVKRILSNEKYKGDALLQKTYTVDYLTKKTKVNEGEIPQYYVEDDHEAIIDPAVFDRVQIELERRCSGKNRHSGVHDFSGKIKCGQCGSWYGSKVWHSTDKYRKVIWRCNHKYGGEKCSTPHLTEEEIKAAFVTAANKALADKDAVIATFRLIKDTVFDTSALEQEKAELTDELNIVAGLIQDGIYQNAHVAQNQADYNKEYETLTARYEKAKSRLDEVEADIHDKNSRRKSIEHYLSLLEERKDAVTEYDVRLWHGMVEFVTVYSKDDILFTMKDGTEIRV